MINEQPEREYLDKFGQTLEVGDEVIFASGQNQDTGIYTGVILKLNQRGAIAIKSDLTGARNLRHCTSVVNIKALKQVIPEAFI